MKLFFMIKSDTRLSAFAVNEESMLKKFTPDVVLVIAVYRRYRVNYFSVVA